MLTGRLFDAGDDGMRRLKAAEEKAGRAHERNPAPTQAAHWGPAQNNRRPDNFRRAKRKKQRQTAKRAARYGRAEREGCEGRYKKIR